MVSLNPRLRGANDVLDANRVGNYLESPPARGELYGVSDWRCEDFARCVCGLTAGR